MNSVNESVLTDWVEYTVDVSSTPKDGPADSPSIAIDSMFERALRHFWHPVCTLTELTARNDSTDPRVERTPLGPLPVTLLGEQLAVAVTANGRVIALADRCVHRSTRLSVGEVVGDTLRCAYHGWRYDGSGRCVDIPSMPDGPIPTRACVASYSATIAYDLVWVRLDDSWPTDVPSCDAWLAPHSQDPALRVLAGNPYTWPVGAARRVENFVDLAHFAWVHDGSLGRRDEPVPPVPEIERVGGVLEFKYESPDMDADGRALFGSQDYEVRLPFTVQITFQQRNGGKRILWMTASPVTMSESRSFWFVSRNDALDEDDAEHLRFQDRILAEDQAVVCNQTPAALSLESGAELSVRTDRVSIEYRRFLRDLALTAYGPQHRDNPEPPEPPEFWVP